MRPNFTGDWKLIRGESDFGFLPPPQLRFDTIVHEDQFLSARTVQKDANGKVAVDRNLVIGGEAVQVMILGRARWIRACWDGDALAVETSTEISGTNRTIADRWTLDATGQWLIIERVHNLPGGAVRQLLRLRRSDPPLIRK